MADDQDNLSDPSSLETEPVIYNDETRVYEQEPEIQTYAVDDQPEPPRRGISNLLLFGLLVVAGVAIAVLIYLFLTRDADDGGGIIPITPSPSGDNSWNQVRTSGRLIVATSLDYPPFSYRNQQFQPDGFDMALIREVAARLGVQTEIQDMAFDSIFNALTVGQSNIAIAAISVTPEREQQMLFSNVYWVGEEGILARADSTITSITTLSQMAGLRIGVQRGSVYETWLQRDLVNTGLTAASNLFVYETADAAVRDLREQRLDLVIGDLRPTEAAVAVGGVKLVGSGLNPQRYAIALPIASITLRDQINAVLTQMQNEGRIAQLAQLYLNVDPGTIVTPPAPTATSTAPTAVPPTQPPTGCVNGMRFVADLNLDDNNMQSPPPMSPGQPFTKGWRIQNSGTCPWTTAYRLVFVSGNTPQASMGGQPTAVQGFVAAGAQYDMYVNLVAPLTPGVHQGIWQMVDEQNRPFGDRIWVGITVPAVATATPQPTQTPSPSIDFRVDRNNILQGECVTFVWTVQGAQAVYFYAQGQAWQNSPVAAQGSRQECPPTTTTYFLRVQRNDGAVEERQITVTVRPNVNAPTIAQFVAAPPQLTVGQCVQLQWDVQGEVQRVTLSNQFRVIWDNAPLRGNTQDCTGAPTTIEYKLVATGPGGSSQALDYVTVVSPATATPVPTAPPTLPVIDSFSVLPAQLQAGQCVQLTWSTSGATTLVRILRNNVLVLDNANLVGSAQDCLQQAGTITYQLVASTATGQSDSRTQSVLVTEAPAQNPLADKTFQVVGLNGNAPIEGTTLTIMFAADGQLSGSGGCNNFNGRYTAANGSITVSSLSMTNVFCGEPPGTMEQEQAFEQALRSVTNFAFLTETMVSMRNAGGQEVLRLEWLQATPRQ